MDLLNIFIIISTKINPLTCTIYPCFSFTDVWYYLVQYNFELIWSFYKLKYFTGHNCMPKKLVPFYIVRYYIKRIKTSLIVSISTNLCPLVCTICPFADMCLSFTGVWFRLYCIFLTRHVKVGPMSFYQWCGSGLIVSWSGSTNFDEYESGSRSIKSPNWFQPIF